MESYDFKRTINTRMNNFEGFYDYFITEILNILYLMSIKREGVQRRHDPRKNDLRTSGFAELPPGPTKLVSQPQ